MGIEYVRIPKWLQNDPDGIADYLDLPRDMQFHGLYHLKVWDRVGQFAEAVFEEGTIFYRCSFTYARLERCVATGPIYFISCELSGCEFINCAMDGWTFVDCKMDYVELSDCTGVEKMRLINCSTRDANLEGYRCDVE